MRAHHLLCLLTYVGKGYTPAFVANYGRVVARLNAGAPVVLVEGPDEICAPMLGEPDCHCRNASVVARDAQALADVAALLGLHLSAGCEVRLDAVRLATLRAAFAAGTIRAACASCQWSGLCTGIAASSFAGVRLTG
nr:DUF1284 domain-containing protein [Ancylobacter koreensis]